MDVIDGLDIEDQHTASICLCAIVRDDPEGAQDMITSTKSFIDYAVICDVGSADKTYNMVNKILEKYEIPNTVVKDQWINEGHNRTLCLLRVPETITHILFLDTNMRLCIPVYGIMDDLKKSLVEYDTYCVLMQTNTDIKQRQLLLFRRHPDVFYTGKIQSKIVLPKHFSRSFPYNDIVIFDTQSKIAQLSKAKRELETCLNDQDVYCEKGKRELCVAQNCILLGRFHTALAWLAKPNDVKNEWYVLHLMGVCFTQLNENDKAIAAFKNAHQKMPSRYESLEALVMLLVNTGKLDEAFILAEYIKRSKMVKNQTQESSEWQEIMNILMS